MMPRWFIYSVAAGFAWALWAVLSKAVDNARLTLAETQLLFTIGLLPPAILAMARSPQARAELRGQWASSGARFAALAGLLGAAGNLAFFAALARGGKASIVIPFTSLYPLVTLITARLVMNERVNRVQLGGFVVAMIGAVLLSGEATNLGQANVGEPAAWMAFATLALIAWGLLSAAQKVSTNAISSELSMACFSAAFVPVTVLVAAVDGLDWSIPARPFALGILAGVMNGVGMLASFAAYAANGKASVVTPLAGLLSSAFTVVLALLFLGERLDGAEAAGIVVAIAAAVALSYERTAPKTAASALLALLFLAAGPARAEQKRIYIAPDDHTDYLWTGNEEEYRQAFVEMIDYYLDLADKTAKSPPEHQSRWHCDGSLWFWTYERNKTPAEMARLIARVRSGHISLPLNALVSTYGGTPTEAVLRGMYYAGTLERRFGLRIPMAIAMENQTLPYGLGALWAGAGAKYTWKGICGCLTKLHKTTRRPHDIYWWRADDGSRLLMKWNTMHMPNSGARTMGSYAECRTPRTEIEFVDRDPRFSAAYPYPVIGIFGKGWDDLKTLTDEFVAVAKEKTTPERKVIVSNMNDFFVDFEKSHGAKLPNFSASFGNEWDLYTASVSELSARVRRAVEKLRAAEALASLVSFQRPGFMANRRAERDEAWMNLGLFWEHNWTADSPVISRQERVDWGRRVAAKIEAYVDGLHADAAYALGAMIKRGKGRRFYVFNPLGWSRTDVADISFAAEGPVHVVDTATGREVPSQVVRLQDGPRHFAKTHLRIEAQDLPPVGYKVFEVRDGAGQAFPPAATVNGNVFENARYKLHVEDRGAISKLVDKTLGNRDFGGANQRKMINDLGLDPGTLAVENAGPVSVTLRGAAQSPLRRTTRITLYRQSRRIDIRNDIEENFDGTYSWDFFFNVEDPLVHHEEVGAVLKARLLADGGHYAPVMSRLEWLTLNHFADMSGKDGAGVTLSNADLAFMQLGDSSIQDGVSRLDTKKPQIKVLAGGQIDAPQAGIPRQGGDSHFLQRFALQTHGRYQATEAMKFALEHQNPPVTGWLRAGGTLPETKHSLVTVSNPEVLLWTLKPAEDGPTAGLVARVWNLTSKPQSFTINLAPGIRTAKRATHIETDLGPLPVTRAGASSTTSATQLQTLRLVP